MDAADLIALKHAILEGSKLVREANRVNCILAITNLISANVITPEQALNNKEYSEFIKTLKDNKDSSNTIKATIRK